MPNYNQSPINLLPQTTTMPTSPSFLLLRLSPLLASTASLTYTICEHLYLSPYLSLRPAPAPSSSNGSNGSNKSSTNNTPNQASSTTRVTNNNNNNKPPTPDPNALLPAYITLWFRPAFSVILTLYPLTWATATANLAAAPPSRLAIASPSGALYLAGLALSFAHMLWGLRAKALLDAIRFRDQQQDSLLVNGAKSRAVEGAEEPHRKIVARDSVAVLASWITLNAWRGVLADLPAWLCFFVGFLLSET